MWTNRKPNLAFSEFKDTDASTINLKRAVTI